MFFAYRLRKRKARLRLDSNEISAVGKTIVRGRRTLRHFFGIDRLRSPVRSRHHHRAVPTKRSGAPSFQPLQDRHQFHCNRHDDPEPVRACLLHGERRERGRYPALLERAPARSDAEPSANFPLDRAAHRSFLALIPHKAFPF